MTLGNGQTWLYVPFRWHYGAFRELIDFITRTGSGFRYTARSGTWG